MRSRSKGSPGAFTLLELLTATAILLLLLWLIFAMIQQMSRTWKASSDRIESFQAARVAFESMNRKISQATVNSYLDYFDDQGRSTVNPAYNGAPKRFGRNSELHFVSGKSLIAGQVTHSVFFLAPLGEVDNAAYAPLKSLLNACGYFIWFGPDASDSFYSARPDFISPQVSPLRYRYRLMEFSQPSEDLQVYSQPGNGWFAPYLAGGGGSTPAARVVAENVIALVCLPKRSDAEEAAIAPDERIGANYEYDSRIPWPNASAVQPEQMNQAPPMMKIVMIAIDESAAKRLQGASTTPPDLGFSYDTLFQDPEQLDNDLQSVIDALNARRINHRVFQTEVPIRGAHWTRAALL